MEKIEHFSHTHPLVLKEIKPKNEGKVLCSGCEIPIFGLCYYCTEPQCTYVLHKSCATLAPQLSYPHHPHPLSLLSSSPYPGPNSYICNNCQKRRNHSNFVYHCSLCQFDLCMPCAWASLSTSHPPLSREQSQRFKQFTPHHHDLMFVDHDPQQYADQLCDACIRPITTTSSPLFVCAQNCGFLLHSSCAELPTTKHHPFHPHHPLTLFPKAPHSTDAIFRCDSCRCLRNGFVYRCEECEFDLDVCCALLEHKIEHQSHKHSLVLQNSSVAKVCKCCNTVSKHVLVCEVCDEFVIDSRCATLPSTAWNAYDKHPLRLIYGGREGKEEECQICKQKMAANLWLYYCEECDFSAHTYCIVRKSNRVKFGGTFEYDIHHHPLTFVEGNQTGQACDACGKEAGIEGWALKCGECNFWMHRQGNCFNIAQFANTRTFWKLSGSARDKYCAKIYASSYSPN